MKAILDDPVAYSRDKLVCSRTVLPRGLEIGNVELGKGSNNRVVEATWGGTECVIRMPRRRSDTQQKGAAVWEFRHMLTASQMGAAPAVYGAWYARHATRDYPTGLYMVTEKFPDDLEDVLMSNSRRPHVLDRSDDIAQRVAALLSRVANADMYLYDLKPSNVVIAFPMDGGPIDVRMIDFGREFCEWAGSKETDASTPIIDMVDRMVGGDATLRRHILFATMLIQLAATTTYCLHTDRREHRMDRETRQRVNGLSRVALTLLESMKGCHVAIVRDVLRTDQVRSVLAHYHGRRNSGTRRTLQLARGYEM